MARKIPPKGSTGAKIRKIVQQGPKPQSTQALAKGQTQSFIKHVEKSKLPQPSQNQRGKVKNLDSQDLIR